MKELKNSLKQNFKSDAIAGLVVFLVAIPLCLGIALASHAPLFSGLIGGIVGGIVVGLISKSNTSISGPAAGLSTIVAASIITLGSFEIFLWTVIIAGVIQVIMGLAKSGVIANYFPSSVIKAMLASIGIILIIKQFPHLIGHDKDTAVEFSLAAMFAKKTVVVKGAKAAVLAITNVKNGIKPIEHNWFESIYINFIANAKDIFLDIHWGALIIGFLCLATMIAWDKVSFLKKSVIPAPLAVIVLGTTQNFIIEYVSPTLKLTGEHLVHVPVSKSISEFLSFFHHPDFNVFNDFNSIKVIFVGGLILAIVASLETLLNVEAVDKLDTHKRNTPTNRELIAQGIGNITSGLIGGLPITSVVVRGSVGIQAGSRSKMTTVIHGLLILVVVSLLPWSLNQIPNSTLAAVLIMTGYKLTKLKIFKEVYKSGYSQFIPFLITLICIFVFGLLNGILIGLVIGFVFVLRNDIKNSFNITSEKHYNENVMRISLPQIASFVNKANIRKILNGVPNNSKVIIDGSYSEYIDYDVREVIHNFKHVMSDDKKIDTSLVGFKKEFGLTNELTINTVVTKDLQMKLTPKEILDILKEGNKRFASGNKIEKNVKDQINLTASDGQHPLAVVLTCIDSRTSSELIFDLGLGDVFSIRIAGNIVNDDILASMEFATKVAGAKLIVVLGHSECGAIKGACDNVNIGKLPILFDKIKPAIDAERVTKIDRNSKNENFVNNVTRLNVHNNVFGIIENSEVLNELVNSGQLGIVGGIYNIRTGEVKFTPMYENAKVIN